MRKTGIVALAFAVVGIFLAVPVRGEVHLYVADHQNRTLIKIKEDGTLLTDSNFDLSCALEAVRGQGV